MGNDVGKRIARLRKKNGWSQNELAEKLNISDKAVSKWENGGMPSVDLFPKLAQLFNVTIDYLMLGDGETEPSDGKKKISAMETEPFVEGIDEFSIEELRLILSDQRDLYTEAELKCIQNKYNQLMRQKLGEKAYTDETYHNKENIEVRRCPKCDVVIENPSRYCEFCGWDLIHNRDGKNEEENRSGVGCLAYVIAFLFPIIGLIYGIVKKDAHLIIFSIVIWIISGIIAFFNIWVYWIFPNITVPLY